MARRSRRWKRNTSVGVRVTGNTIAMLAVMIIVVGACYGLVDNLGISSDGLSASGKSHECTGDSIEATVSDDGSLVVVEARTYSFTGSYELSAIQLDPPEGGSVKVKGVAVIDEGGTRTKLSKTDFQESWREYGGPGDGYWAYDSEEGVLYAFSDTQDETKTFVFSYTYKQAVNVYSDVAELYWQFVPAGWDTDTHNVTLTVSLPVAKGESVSGGDNVLAFGHGSDGDVAFADDGTVVFTADTVAAGEFAEARVTFPASWIAASAVQAESDEGLPGILEEEEQWAAETQAAQLRALLGVVAALLVSVVLIVGCVVLFRRYGKEHKPQFDGEYWRDVPAKGLHPSVVARIWRWDEENADDLTVTLMYLSVKGVIQIEPATATRKRVLLGDKEEATYALRSKDESLLESMSDIDRRAFDFVFKTIGAGAQSVTLKQIEQYGKDHPNDFIAKMDAFQLTVSHETGKHEFFEAKGRAWKSCMLVMSVLLAVAALVCSLVMSSFIVFACLAPGIAVMFGISFVMPRRSREAVEVQAKCKALKRWFKEFTALDEGVPTDTKVWGELFVYAYLFGVAERVAEDLGKVAPQVLEGPTCDGWMYWYVTPHAEAHAAACSADFFGTCFSNTVSSAQAAVNAATNMAGGSGHSLGGGGSFTMGGGGGFGGGGGGFSR